MAVNAIRSDYSDDGIQYSQNYHANHESEESFSNDAEEGPPSTVGYERKDDPFGDETKSEVKYRTMAWWQVGMVMIAETISLGILSLPSVFAAIGTAPGVILISGLGLLATYTGFVIGQFKLKYPHVHNMADAAQVMAGRIGRELLGAAQLLFLVFAMGSHLLTFSIMMNTVTDHGACTIVFGSLGLVVCVICTLPRTLHRVSYMSIVSFISIVTAVIITMTGVGAEGSGNGEVDVTIRSSFVPAFLAVTNIIFAYAGHVAFFSFISEMKTPETYPKALVLLQGVDTFMYLTVAIVTYCYAGSNVTSPALGSTSPLLRKIAYGVAIPTIIVAGVIYGHVAAKFVYVRLYRGTDKMSQRSWTSFGLWAMIVLVLWIIAWIIAEAIPVFNDLLAIMTALFASWFTYGLSGIFWLFMNRGRYGASPRKMLLTGLNITIVCIGATICGAGLYVSGKSIHDHATSSSGSFSCADNSMTS